MNLPPDVETAINTAAENARLSPYALLQKTSQRAIVEARRHVFLDLRAKGYSLPWIARWFNLHHATVLHHLNRPEFTPSKPVKERHMVQLMCWEKEVYCDHCGRRGKTEEFEPEGHHLICRLRMACEERYQDYLEFSKRLGSEMRQRYIDTAYRSSNRSQVEQSNQV